MRYYISTIITAFILTVSLAGCDLFTGSSDSGPVTLTGLVINSVTSEPIAQAFIRVSPDRDEQTVETNARAGL